MFSYFKEKIKKIYNAFTTKASSLFSRTTIDEEFLKELETLLLSADTGITLTKKIMGDLRNDILQKKIHSVPEIKIALKNYLISYLKENTFAATPSVVLLVGINGSGKTTFAAKYASLLLKQQKKVLLVAGDTFRAAATQQLEQWAHSLECNIFIGRENQDPASVIFEACEKYNNEKYDHLIIDTAGRLQTKINLMRELEKIKKIVLKKIEGKTIETWIVLDSMLGQNSIEQARLFNEATHLNGIVMTKLDGTGKGGTVFAISQDLAIPIRFISFGEKVEDIKLFDRDDYVTELIGE